jgi:UDP-N-acetylmuramate: L-alanyl-gamma-D-glutamyl-meso-diaminopimelate ligase
VPVPRALAALKEFKGIARRMQLAGEARGVRVYDDFAHHPTAIATTVDGLRRRVGAARIIAVLEPRSHTMRMGVHRDTLAPAFAGADQVWLYAPADLGWNVEAVARELGARGEVRRDVDALVRDLAGAVRSGDHVLIMSNGGFGGLHGKLLAALRQAPHP